jgi:hypothetical protein
MNRGISNIGLDSLIADENAPDNTAYSVFILGN